MDYVNHEFAIGVDGLVYMMHGSERGLVFSILKPFMPTEMQKLALRLDAMLSQKKPAELLQQVDAEQGRIDDSAQLCRSRWQMLLSSLDYTNNLINLSDSAINNDVSCSGRAIPPYLLRESGVFGSYFSVSYNWGGFDSVDEFNKKISYMKAGNVNTKINALLTCAAGVDCSGYVSRVFGLAAKLSISVQN